MHHRRTSTSARRPVRIPELEHVKTAVVNSLATSAGPRTYAHAIDAFLTWYCGEPRLGFSRTVVLGYRVALERRGYAPATAFRQAIPRRERRPPH